MATYANQTQVSTDRSLQEIRATLNRYGATNFGFVEGQDSAAVAFTINDRQVRFELVMPDREDQKFHRTAQGRARERSVALKAWEQECRQRWRALALVVKAKLEAVDAGIATFEQEFFANLVLPGGMTVYQKVAPAVHAAVAGNPTRILEIGGGKL